MNAFDSYSQPVLRALTANHSQPVLRALTHNHSQPVLRGRTINHNETVLPVANRRSQHGTGCLPGFWK